ncbi:hypothetical protein [Qipengyuania marisflavi]|uniref:Uncharacterized protein n=1 Tax=Qipengyuania marisflavi TaxID=2486356 RepID=A0A5S3P6U9_9SPHN|nr:hypothetical protein [Qipengyuania marisflavi]TMM48732.1 hypothetical protein FEV51_04870 [Qipengyuania marisflavi]
MNRTLAILLALAAPVAANAGDGAPAMPETERAIASLRPVAVTIAQERIGTSVDVGRVVTDGAGGGLIGALVIAGMDNKRSVMTANAADRADAAVAPLADVLMDFDVAGLALETTRKAIAAPEWFAASEIELVPGAAFNSVADFVAANPAQQVGLVSYRYQMSPDFTQLQIIADLSVAHGDNLKRLYGQQIVSSVRLAKRSYEPSENVTRWSAENGRVAKAALTAAFARLETLIPAVMALTPAQFDAATDKKRESAFTGGFHGPVLMRDAAGPVIWSKGDGFIAVQAATD